MSQKTHIWVFRYLNVPRYDNHTGQVLITSQSTLNTYRILFSVQSAAQYVCLYLVALFVFILQKMRQTTTKFSRAKCVTRFVTSHLKVPLRDSRFFCYIR